MAALLERDSCLYTEIELAVRTDDQGGITLGREFSGKNYRVSQSGDGDLILTLVVVIPERDTVLYSNPAAVALFCQGLVEAKSGRTVPAADFSQYVDLEIDEE